MGNVDLACIIDDDPISVFTAKRMMELAGFCDDFLVYENGKMALEGLTALVQSGGKLPAIILLDLNMPIMDGWQFLDAFTHVSPSHGMKTYIVSSSIHPDDVEKARAYKQVSGYITKPLSPETFEELGQKLG